ncbi:MAG: DUF4367 domain-containing protein [Lachnospiraceae bacterium]|nr:DUF4367 domain-containing protein [Lachnospiraceae bacterium]
MKIENIRHEFPEMPEEMRAMIRDKVAEQLADGEAMADECRDAVKKSAAGRRGRKNQRHPKRLAVLVLAATVVLGTTAFAGARLYQMYSERVGQYGMRTTVEMGGSQMDADEYTNTENTNAAMLSGGEAAGTESTVQQGADAKAAGETEAVKKYENATIKAGYLPEGMVEAPGGYSWYYEDTPRVGISAILYELEEGDTFEVVDTDVISSESIDVNGHEGVYLTRQVYSTGTAFDRIIYVTYPEADLVLQLYVAENVSQEEALKFAEGIELVELDSPDEKPEKKMSWIDYVKLTLFPETEVYEPKLSVTQEEMKNIRSVGEAFALESYACDENGESMHTEAVTARVAEVQILDNLSLLDPKYIDYYLADQVDEQGNLLPNEIQYVKTGDGIDTTNEILGSETVPQKLVYVSVEYTNTGDIPLYNILFIGNMMKIQETENGYEIFDREKDRGGEDCDKLECSGLASSPEMRYYDTERIGDNNGSNYIEALQPGESTTIHMGFIVNEDELGYLYLNLCGSSGGYEFSQRALETGYVDLRQ